MTTVILRFRDVYNQTNGHTVDEHNAIVAAKGSCWWGWWKKQNEEVPLELLSTLSRASGLQIFLLDSGRRQLHKVSLLGILVNVDKSPVSSPDAGELTPEYYRANSYPAWFRLSRIESCDEAELNGLIYEQDVHDDVVPGAKSLTGTRIASIRELLQFGNVTYWVAASAPAGAPVVEERLLPRRILPPIAPRDVVLCESPWILHISDIHASRAKHFYRIDDSDAHNTSLATEVFRAVQDSQDRIQGVPGIVVVSGDLTWTGSQAEFELALRILEDIRSTLGLTRRQFVIVPGNHDIQWSSVADDYRGAADVTVAGDSATENYRRFFFEWYKTPAGPSLSVGTRFFCFGGPTLDVLGLNSSELAQAEGAFAGMGRVTDGAFDAASRDFGWEAKLRPAQVRVLVTHHHVRPVAWVERPGDAARGFGVAIDAAAVVRRAQALGVDVLLHGHQHQPYFGVANDALMAEGGADDQRQLLIAGAGSCGVVDHDLGAVRQRSFQLLRAHAGGEVEALLFQQGQDTRRFELASRFSGGRDGWKRLR